ncbi:MULTISPECIES: LA_2478/LA_2722/LA_4182 family protein [Leptospira]|uniref:LA_2478/LA_2722/LA_4182 family protein n=1 Tax=Leptospira TaxID=171 RepID=UPI0002983DD7|nr:MULTISPECIES: hypothetical protein [Leptospira]EKQ84803.1 hypothetical protein LEP1GSC064_2803 [Leptospira kirschneri serovar Grippotyphosa str. Moskva]KON76705.1 Uncharacterized protein NV38_0002633 [Leptospira kirschneri serovar Mozdok]KPZ77597.1 hypothetical protein APS47_10445 [Leptospira kirschneri serovar Mozdok]KXZ23774.1 hypothetical protein AYB32_06370 [Leptospira kirschneri]KXZ26554.1 hypothetical protein AYB34_05245 [Leptospira sp. ZV016]
MERNKLFLIFGIFLFLNVSGCKKKTLPQGIQDEVWREESSELVSVYCQKISICAKPSLKELKESSKTLIQERLNPANCAEKFRKSNAYLLANEDPETVKKTVRGCFQTVIKESCDKIQKGILDLSEDCKLLQAIQSK